MGQKLIQIPVELQHKTGYASLSEKGLILEANLTCATLFGNPFSSFIAKDAQDDYYFLPGIFLSD
ncbi:hypothetical protein N9C84_03680 [Desulfobacterales bacterium]|nr:hypothetical protein [Desulfobacterales bacterium]